jgi:hypothetical protein
MLHVSEFCRADLYWMTYSMLSTRRLNVVVVSALESCYREVRKPAVVETLFPDRRCVY